jgi:TonB-dependent starch-binding outer membrane protein SusC
MNFSLHQTLLPLRRLAFLAILGLFSINMLNAQKLTGKVSAETGESLVSVSIKLKGTDKGTLSDVDGNFSLDLPVGQANTLVFSYIGYEDQMLNYTLKAGETPSVNVTLKPSTTNLNSVVVVGYGTKSKREVTGSVVSIQNKDIKEQSVTSFDQALAG